jgi:uncharacterized protein (TIGR00661 family)
VYQTSQKYQRLLPALTGLKHRCIIYGFGGGQDSRNLWFRGHSEEGFLEDLASCRYVITNGGHNVISEALYLGKPVFSFPIPLAYEQFFNAHMLKALGYGEYSLLSRPGVGLFESFENRLAMYRSRISQGDFCGNKNLAARVEELIHSGNRRNTKAGELGSRNGH